MPNRIRYRSVFAKKPVTQGWKFLESQVRVPLILIGKASAAVEKSVLEDKGQLREHGLGYVKKAPAIISYEYSEYHSSRTFMDLP